MDPKLRSAVTFVVAAIGLWVAAKTFITAWDRLS